MSNLTNEARCGWPTFSFFAILICLQRDYPRPQQRATMYDDPTTSQPSGRSYLCIYGIAPCNKFIYCHNRMSYLIVSNRYAVSDLKSTGSIHGNLIGTPLPRLSWRIQPIR